MFRTVLPASSIAYRLHPNAGLRGADDFKNLINMIFHLVLHADCALMHSFTSKEDDDATRTITGCNQGGSCYVRHCEELLRRSNPSPDVALGLLSLRSQ